MHNRGMKNWVGDKSELRADQTGMLDCLAKLDSACYVLRSANGLALSTSGTPTDDQTDVSLLHTLPPLPATNLGDPDFLRTYNLRYAYMAGSMANAISSVDLVIALGKVGMLGSFGAGGIVPARLEEAIRQVQAALPNGPYAFNIINSPNEPALEEGAVDLYLRYGVRVVEASAYLRLTPHIVRYRVAGLSRASDGSVVIGNRVIAKLSRREVATQFLSPAPERMLKDLVAAGQITAEQAELATQVPMADDITVEADSGGHTDNRPLVVLMPSVMALRDELQAQYNYAVPVRIGAAGGIGTPIAALGAFMMGAAYIVTGSVNHACVEAGTSERVKALLADAASTDVMMAPAADMFEMGVNVQVLKRGTMFGLRGKKLYDVYRDYPSIEAIPVDEREKLEKQIFQRGLDDVWADCVDFFQQRDPSQIAKAQQDPKRKMALIFRWYLGLATRWGILGLSERSFDYQIWCGPAMGAFNDWTRGTYLEQPENRRVADVGMQLMESAAALYRLQHLKTLGIHLPLSAGAFLPRES